MPAPRSSAVPPRSIQAAAPCQPLQGAPAGEWPGQALRPRRARQVWGQGADHGRCPAPPATTLAPDRWQGHRRWMPAGALAGVLALIQSGTRSSAGHQTCMPAAGWLAETSPSRRLPRTSRASIRKRHPGGKREIASATICCTPSSATIRIVPRALCSGRPSPSPRSRSGPVREGNSRAAQDQRRRCHSQPPFAVGAFPERAPQSRTIPKDQLPEFTAVGRRCFQFCAVQTRDQVVGLHRV